MSAQMAFESLDLGNDTSEASAPVLRALAGAERALPASCGGCDTRWKGTSMTHCGSCHRTFGSLHGFDAHRTGAIDARRCATDDELREHGYEPNERGSWRQPRPADTLPVGATR